MSYLGRSEGGLLVVEQRDVSARGVARLESQARHWWGQEEAGRRAGFDRGCVYLTDVDSYAMLMFVCSYEVRWEG